MTWVAEYAAPDSIVLGSHFIGWAQAAAWLREMARRTAPPGGERLLREVATALSGREFTASAEGHHYTLRQEAAPAREVTAA